MNELLKFLSLDGVYVRGNGVRFLVTEHKNHYSFQVIEWYKNSWITLYDGINLQDAINMFSKIHNE